MECEKCLHKRKCDLWRSLESQDARCYGEDYFEKEKAKTNADCIRSMSDQELADFIDKCEAMGYQDSSISRDENGNCMNILEWLRRPSEEE